MNKINTAIIWAFVLALALDCVVVLRSVGKMMILRISHKVLECLQHGDTKLYMSDTWLALVAERADSP